MGQFKEYGDYDATGLADLVAKGEVTPHELLDAALQRVERLNPDLNAVVYMAVDSARRLISEGVPAGPFTGVPFLLKDLGAEATDFPSHNGSRLFADTVYDYDSEIYLRFKRSGLVTFGRTASPELGMGPVTESQVYGGATRNPWDVTRTSGGSSGGAGAAVAAGILPAAHGSDGGGSVRIPASCCGLVGFKPTRARMPDGPAAGEGWAGMATDGVLTRSLRDTAALLDATQGPDLGAPYWPPPLSGSFAQAMAARPKPLRVALCLKTLGGLPIDPECRQAVEKTGQLLEGLGHEVFEFSGSLDAESMMLAWCKIAACGTALAVRSKAPDATRDPESIEGVTRGALHLADQVSGADYLQSVNSIHSFGRQMAHLFEGFDVLVTPTLAEPPAAVGRFKPDNENFLDYRMGPTGILGYSPFAPLFNASGQPALSLPLHWTAEGLPVGVQFAAPFGADERLIALAAQIEEAADWRPQQQSLIARLMAVA